MEPWMGMPASFEVLSLDTATSAVVATDVSAKLVATATDGIGPFATFVTHHGLTLGKVRPAKAEEAMLRFRTRHSTPDSREGDNALASTYAQLQLHPSAGASAHAGTNDQATDIRHRPDWAPTKDQVMSDAKAGLLAVQATGPSNQAKSIVDPFGWKSATGLSRFIESYISSSGDTKQWLVDLIKVESLSDLSSVLTEMGATPDEKCIIDRLFLTPIPSLAPFNKATKTSSFLEVNDEPEFKFKDGQFKQVSPDKGKFHKVTSFKDLVFTVSVIFKCLEAFYNTAITRRRGAEVLAKMEELHRRSEDMDVVAKYVEIVFKYMRVNRDSIIRQAMITTSDVGIALSCDDAWNWAAPKQWVDFERSGHLQTLMRKNQLSAIERQNNMVASLQQRLAFLEKSSPSGKTPKGTKQTKDTKRPATTPPSNAPSSPKKPRAKSTGTSPFTTSYGKMLISKDALASLLSTKLGVDTSNGSPNAWLAKAKDAWIAASGNQGKCFSNHFLKGNGALAACRFGARCRTEQHG